MLAYLGYSVEYISTNSDPGVNEICLMTHKAFTWTVVSESCPETCEQMLEMKNTQTVPGDPKNGTRKIFTLQNGNICKQDTDNLSLSLSTILSLRNLIFNKE